MESLIYILVLESFVCQCLFVKYNENLIFYAAVCILCTLSFDFRHYVKFILQCVGYTVQASCIMYKQCYNIL